MDSDEVFEKKQECAKYVNVADDYLEDHEWESYKLIEIFYSIKINSCIASFERKIPDPNNWIFFDYDIYDLLTKNIIGLWKTESGYREIIEELKWE